MSFAFEGLRALEGAINTARLTPQPLAGLTETVLACLMIAILILRPGGLFPAREIGDLLSRLRRPAPRADATPTATPYEDPRP